MSNIFSVNSFKAALTNGGVRPNQFMVNIFPGAAIADFRTAPFLVNVAELPGETLNPAIVMYRGREIKFAGDRVFSPWTATVLNDSDMTIRKGLENWMQLMENRLTKVGELVPAVYQGTINIDQLDRNGKVLRSYALNGAFPIDLSPISLDFGANDQISQFTVTFQYQDFISGPVV